jgi:hypothetical protein
MKTRHLWKVAALLPLVTASVQAAEPASPETAPKSTFVMPNSPKDGRDPFFPNSMRPYESNPDAKKVDNSMLHTLRVGSIMNAGGGRLLAIINNHAFAPGDEGTVINDNGQRINIRCLEIDPKANTVTIESNGARATLSFSDKP